MDPNTFLGAGGWLKFAPRRVRPVAEGLNLHRLGDFGDLDDWWSQTPIARRSALGLGMIAVGVILAFGMTETSSDAAYLTMLSLFLWGFGVLAPRLLRFSQQAITALAVWAAAIPPLQVPRMSAQEASSLAFTVLWLGIVRWRMTVRIDREAELERAAKDLRAAQQFQLIRGLLHRMCQLSEDNASRGARQSSLGSRPHDPRSRSLQRSARFNGRRVDRALPEPGIEYELDVIVREAGMLEAMTEVAALDPWPS